MQHGIERGDRVAVWSPNNARWVLAALGLQMAGAVLVPLNTRMKAAEAADILERSGSRLLFVIGDFLETDFPQMLAAECPSNIELQVLMNQRAAAPLSCTIDWQTFIERGESITKATAIERCNSIQPDDIADLLFTSGTTGKPKGVMSSHGACLRAFSEFVKILGLRAGDRYLVINPFFHAFGYKAGWLSCLSLWSHHHSTQGVRCRSGLATH